MMSSVSQGSRSGCVKVGDIIADRYRVDAILGKGGMGVVTRVTDLYLAVVRAMKVMHPIYLQEPNVVERFIWEAHAASRLYSEHVVKVHDSGKLPSGVPYLVMDLLHGEDFAKICERRVMLPVTEAVGYVLQACEAIRQAHAAGIVHRDIKPANLFLTYRQDGSPCVKVLDFGISKQDAAEDLDLTRAGEMLGSPPYMSPEQIRSTRSVDGRADVWALGAILYKLVTGRTPFHAPTMPRVILSILDDKPARPASDRRPSILPELDAIILRCLEKNVNKRWPNVEALIEALRPFCPEPRMASASFSDPSSPRSQRHRSVPPVSGPTPVWDHPLTPSRGLHDTQSADLHGWLQRLRSQAVAGLEDTEPSSRRPTSRSRSDGQARTSSLCSP